MISPLFSLPLSYTHTFFLSSPHSLTHTHTLSSTLSLCLTHTHTHTIFLPHSSSLTFNNTHTLYTFSLTLPLSQTHCLTHSLSHTHCLTHSLFNSRTHTSTRTRSLILAAVESYGQHLIFEQKRSLLAPYCAHLTVPRRISLYARLLLSVAHDLRGQPAVENIVDRSSNLGTYLTFL